MEWWNAFLFSFLIKRCCGSLLSTQTAFWRLNMINPLLSKGDAVLHEMPFMQPFFSTCQQPVQLLVYVSVHTHDRAHVWFLSVGATCWSFFLFFFLWCGRAVILSPPRSRALEYASCFCCHSACSAFLAISYNGALERRDVIKPLKLLQLEFHLSGNTSRPVEGTCKKTPRRSTTARTSLDTRTKVNDCFHVCFSIPWLRLHFSILSCCHCGCTFLLFMFSAQAQHHVGAVPSVNSLLIVATYRAGGGRFLPCQ